MDLWGLWGEGCERTLCTPLVMGLQGRKVLVTLKHSIFLRTSDTLRVIRTNLQRLSLKIIHESEKKRKYQQHVLDVETGSSTPLVFGANDGTGSECQMFLCIIEI